jgi:hypothetical protein
VVGLDGEGAEVEVRQRQKLTGERVTAAGWFRWKSDHGEWLGSISEMRRSFPGGYSGQWEADGGGPRRIEDRRSGRRRWRWCSGLWASEEQKREWNGERRSW